MWRRAFGRQLKWPMELPPRVTSLVEWQSMVTWTSQLLQCFNASTTVVRYRDDTEYLCNFVLLCWSRPNVCTVSFCIKAAPLTFIRVAILSDNFQGFLVRWTGKSPAVGVNQSTNAVRKETRNSIWRRMVEQRIALRIESGFRIASAIC